MGFDLACCAIGFLTIQIKVITTVMNDNVSAIFSQIFVYDQISSKKVKS